MREHRGCEKDDPRLFVDFDPTLQRCPWSQLDDEIWTLLGWWREWRSFRSLPYPGNMAEQPNFVFEAIEVCEQEAKAYEDECIKKHQKKLRQDNG